MKLTGAQIIIECILEQGITTVFGYPGGTVLPIYDAIYEYSSRLRHILPAHEQGGAHAADGFFRASGKTGVCIATSGPGATNLVTGIATAYMDSVPVVFITGNIDSAYIGTDSFQEVDITGVTLPVTKHSVLIKDIRSLAPSLRDAFRIANEGRPGPVLVDVPKDIQTALAEFQPQEPLQQTRPAISQKRIDIALALINSAKRPVILAGGGVIRSGAAKTLTAFAEKLDIPVCCTLMGLGSIPASHPLFLGFAGMHGKPLAGAAIAESDLIIAAGTRFSERLIGSPKALKEHAKILHIDIDRAEINKNIRSDAHIVGDTGEVLLMLTGALAQKRRRTWTSRLTELREENVLREPSLPEALMHAVRPAIGPGGIVVTDVGQHQMWAAANIPAELPGTFITSGGTGTMGYGLGAAIGAKLARPDVPVVLITGDGGLRMNMGELSTLSGLDLPIIIMLINNGSLGMVRQQQTLFCGARHSGVELGAELDYAKLAGAFGLRSAVIHSAAGLAFELEKSVAENKAVLLECLVGAEELVRPTVRPGGAINDYLLTQEERQ